MMGLRVIVVAGLGAAVALAGAFLFALHAKPLPPAFPPAANPYANAIYAQGIVESDQSSGANINLNPEVGGPVTGVFVQEGQHVAAGAPLIALDDSVPRANADQQRQQAEAAATQLAELRAEPRRETLAVAHAQLLQAGANLKLAQDQWAKQARAYQLDARAVSREALDTADNTRRLAGAAVEVAQRQYELTRAGAWRYDIETEARQAAALASAYAAAKALLAKYVLRAPREGVVMAVNAPLGGYVSAQGVYDTYTQGQAPAVVMAAGGQGLQVRCYVDEILLQQLPRLDGVRAQMTLRGSSRRIPLRFVRVQPYLSPKIELSDQRQERVDLRVLPVIFRFTPPAGVAVYPGQLADIFISRG